MGGLRWLTLAVAGGLLGLSQAMAQSGLRRFLEGHWVGEGLEIRVDQDAVQANDNPQKPFEWNPLTITDLSGRMISFQIGPRRYVGLIEGQQMTVTIAGYRGSYVLTKMPPPDAQRMRP